MTRIGCGDEGHRDELARIEFEEVACAIVLDAGHDTQGPVGGGNRLAHEVGEVDFTGWRRGQVVAGDEEVRALEGFRRVAVAHLLQVGDEFVPGGLEMDDLENAAIACGQRLVGCDVGGIGGKTLELHGTADAVGPEDAADEDGGGHFWFSVPDESARDTVGFGGPFPI